MYDMLLYNKIDISKLKISKDISDEDINVILVKEKTIKHGVQFRHERKGYVNYRDNSGCILRY